MFTLTRSDVERLFALNAVEVPDANVVLLGLRGCLPSDPENCNPVERLSLELTDTNYQRPRCSIVVCRRSDNRLAAYPGSTVPHVKHVRKAAGDGGRGTNQLFTGFYGDYRKGVHRAGADTAHPALRQSSPAPIRRTADDLDYEEDDFADIELAGDNIHAAWTATTEADNFESAGCQVIVGYPQCAKRGALPATGAWAEFWAQIDSQTQEKFGYLLLPGREAQTATLAPRDSLTVKLRFGSRGPLVEKLQRRLQESGYYEGVIDADFGPRTFRAVTQFQKSVFVRSGDDGVVGPQTAQTLDLSLPVA